MAVTDDKIIGFVALMPKERVLAELFLWPNHIGKGAGKALLNFAKETMPTGFTLYTTSTNTRARHFYEREGLTALREGPHPRSRYSVTYYEWQGQKGSKLP